METFARGADAYIGTLLEHMIRKATSCSQINLLSKTNEKQENEMLTILNEVLVVGGPVAASEFALENGRKDIAECIEKKTWNLTKAGFNSERARARVEAVAWLKERERKKKSIAKMNGG